MKSIVGMIKPETNWAPKLDLNSTLVPLRENRLDLPLPPNTLTSDWPVNASSIWPLSSPVDFHCSMKSFCERLPITAVTKIDTGIVTSAMSASTGEMTNIIMVTPMMVSTEVRNWLSVCCSACEMLSMSLVTRLSSSPRVCLSK